jgi:cysteine desulfuration protein SufE
MKIEEIEKSIVEDFALFDEWSDKYQYIIELGQKLSPLDDKYKLDENRIKGCQSSVWLHAYSDNGKVFFEADSDSTFVKGEIALLVNVLSGQNPKDIVDADLKFVDGIGLREHIAVTRANGLSSMIKQMKLYALAFDSKESA